MLGRAMEALSPAPQESPSRVRKIALPHLSATLFFDDDEAVELPATLLAWLEDLERRRPAAIRLGMALLKLGHPRAERVIDCSSTIWVEVGPQHRSGWHAFLRNSCGFRFCPICRPSRGRLAARTVARKLFAVEWVGCPMLYVTLHGRVCSINAVQCSVAHLKDALRRLRHHPRFPGVGGYWQLEFTRFEDGLVRPHVHLLVAVQPSYTHSRRYLSAAAWEEVWAETSGVAGPGAVFVQRVSDVDSVRHAQNILQYGSKAVDDSWGPEEVAALEEAVRGVMLRHKLPKHPTERRIRRKAIRNKTR